MKSVENILVPVDFSDESIIGLEAAVEIAQKFDCKINLVHFVLPSSDISPKHPKEEVMGMTDTLHHTQLRKAQQEMYDKLKSLLTKAIPNSHQGQIWVVASDISDGFGEFTEDSKIDMDLIVTGTSGDQNILEFFIGNHTDKMIRSTEIPTLAIKANEKIDFKNVLLATDLINTHPEKVKQFCRSLQKSGSIVARNWKRI